MNGFKIDEVNLYEQLGIEQIVALSRCFYAKVYADTNPEFRTMFPADMEGAIRNQYEFFVQRLGGPPLYSSRKGHPALRPRHARFPITRENVERWLAYMREAMVEVGIPDDARGRLDEFFSNSGSFLQNIDEHGRRLY